MALMENLTKKGMSKTPGKSGHMMMLPDGTDLRQVKVLSQKDWNRIQNTLHMAELEREEKRRYHEEKEAMKQQSMNLWKNWTNTIAGARQKKLEARKVREAAEEEQRKKVDIEEELYRAEERRKALEKNKMKQYYQTDRVKNFHSALRLTEVLRERDAQVELKKAMALAERSKSEPDPGAWMKKLEQSNIADAEAHNRRYLTPIEQAASLREQMKRNEKKAVAEREKEEEEGLIIAELAREHNEEKARLQSIARGEKEALLKDYHRQMDDRKKLHRIEALMEETEDEECRLFADAKRKMMKLRAEKERQIQAEKLEQLDKIRDKLRAQQEARISDEKERLDRAVEEIEFKNTENERLKAEKRSRELKEIAEYRQAQNMRKQKEREKDEEEDNSMLKKQKEVDELFFKNEEEKRKRRFDDAKKNNEYLQRQMDERQKELSGGREQEKEYIRRNVQLQDLEEQEFQNYAGKVIHHFERKGQKKNLYPMRKAAQPGIGGGSGPVQEGTAHLKPSYRSTDVKNMELPTWKRNSTDQVKKDMGSDRKTGNRLGFNFS